MLRQATRSLPPGLSSSLAARGRRARASSVARVAPPAPLGRADGLLVHSAGPIDGGWAVIDFWESTEAFDRFTQNKLMPVTQQLGDRAFPSPPERKDFTVHNLEQHGD